MASTQHPHSLLQADGDDDDAADVINQTPPQPCYRRLPQHIWIENNRAKRVGTVVDVNFSSVTVPNEKCKGGPLPTCFSLSIVLRRIKDDFLLTEFFSLPDGF